MGSALQARSADSFLRERVELRLIAIVAPLVGGANALSPLADALVVAPNAGLEVLLLAIKSVPPIGITVESTDAQIDSAITAASTIAVLKKVYNIV